jgi:uncharacterized protein
MKILAASDLHGESKLVKKLAQKAESENVDLVILCGDITGFSETKNLIKPFKDKNKHVILLPGNWDSFATTDFLANFYGVKNIHGYSAIYENIGFFGAGGARGPGPGDISDSELLKTLEKAHSGLSKTPNVKRKIMLTHQHPSNSISEISGVQGSKALTKAIQKFKPDFLLHGHIHEAAGMEDQIGSTKVINVGRDGKIIEL